MPRSVFVSYSHQQGDWVWGRLVPVLKAAGVEVLIDLERFKAGGALYPQMDAIQDKADMSLLVLSPEYLASDPCQHEMNRAIAKNPTFDPATLSALPLLRVKCPLPAPIQKANPLWISLEDDTLEGPWDKLLEACKGDLVPPAPAWLAARDETRTLLERGQSVNLEVTDGAAWRQLLEALKNDGLPDLAIVDLHQGRTADRRGLVEEILHRCGGTVKVPVAPADLGVLDRFLTRCPSRVALTHFDILEPRQESYGLDLFAALRDLVSERRLLTLLAISRTPAAQLFPHDHPFSALDLKTVLLRGPL